MTVSIVFPELVMVCAISGPLPGAWPERLPELGVTVQVKVVPGTVDKTWILEVCCEQMVCAGGLKKTSGVCTTVTV